MDCARRRITILIVLLSSAFAVSGSLGVAGGGELAPGGAARPNTPQYFDAHVAPLLARHCLECHDGAKKKGKLDLSRKDAALAGGKHGKVIVPGKSAESLLWEQVESDEMPEDRPSLSAKEKQLLKDWIEAGAVWSGDTLDPLLVRDGRAAQNWLRRLTVAEYVETVRAAVGVDVEADARRLLPPDGRADGFTNTAYNLSVDLAHVEAFARLASVVVGKMDAEAFAARFSKRKELKDEAMRELIGSMGKWLLRGPLDEQEVEAFLRVPKAVAEDGGGHADAVRYVLEAMLQSPRFVYRIEKQRGDGAARPADPYELASRMSYSLWGAPPDKELTRAADAGELSDRNCVASHVRRMLDDPRAVNRSKQFISDWLNLDRLATLRPNKQRFPNWDEQLAADMREETLAFFEEVAWKQKRPLADLLNAKVTFATPRLAAHYGLTPNPSPSVAPSVAPAATVAAVKGPERVTRALKALYTFEEGKGDTVRDVSGTGEGPDLKIEDAKAVKWTGAGLVVKGATLIATARPPPKLIESLSKSSDLTIEAWVTPAGASQSGPARIVTLSGDPTARNFTLGQDGDKFDVRLRTKGTDGNGLPSLGTAAGAARTRPTHVVYTRDANGKAKIYVDGEQKAARDVGGELSNWDRGFRLAVANELTKDRPWLGTLHLVALYDTALSAEEISRNRAAGARRAAAVAGAAPSSAHDRRDLLAMYRFDEGSGDTVRDTSGAEPLDLKMDSTSGVRWDAAGLTVNEPTLISSASPPKRLVEALKNSNALTLEAWVAPRDAKQAGPARVLTLSSGSGTRNFTLGQDEDKYHVRLRSKTSDANGLPALVGPSGSAEPRLTHVVYTRERSGQARLYVDGEEKGVANVGGDFSNWDGSFRLALANETTKDRPWRGTFRRVAIYGRALSADDVRALRSTPPPPQGLARYDLTSVPFRGGLLTQGSVLTVGGEEASTVARGLFVLKELLHSAVGSAPPGVDTTPVPPKPGLSTRAIAEGRLAISSCSGCHSNFEPLAFGIGKFDGVGAYRDKDDHGNVLRDDGEVTLPGEDKPAKFRSAAEFMDLLARSDRVRMNFTRKVTQFALGRPLVESDGPELEKIHKAAQEAGGTYAAVITAVVMSDWVQTTRTEAGR
jgi:hypothetical protein